MRRDRRRGAGRALACAFAAVAAFATPAAAGIYGYTDEQGVLHLTDQPPADGRFRLLLAEHEGRAPAIGARLMPMQARPYHPEIAQAARTHGLDPALLHALISVESAYRPEAVSGKGARGLMQLMPATASRYGVTEASLHQPAVNIMTGTRHLADLLRAFSGDMRLALAAYNAGEGAVLAHGGKVPPFAETQAYVPRVLKLYEALRRP